MSNIIEKDNRLIAPAEELSFVETPLYGSVAAGYPAEAYNYIEDRIDLNKYIIRNKSANRCLWATTMELTGPGISYGDLLVIDVALKPPHDSTVCLYLINGDYSLRWVEREDEGLRLNSPNVEVSPIFIAKEERVERVGTLTHRLKRFFGSHRLSSNHPDDYTNFISEGMDYNRYFLGETGYWETLFYLRAGGNSMAGDGIIRGDLLVVDRLAEAYEDSIMVFLIGEAFTLKRILRHKNYVELVGSNPSFPPIRVDQGTKLEPWGVVTGSITEYLKNHEALHTCGSK